jgi:hypothetical protein
MSRKKNSDYDNLVLKVKKRAPYFKRIVKVLVFVITFVFIVFALFVIVKTRI